jgi:hypothetical protein
VVKGYPLDTGLLDELNADGFEIGMHGDRHDCRLPYLNKSEIVEAFEQCLFFIERYGVRGFRSPFLLRSQELYEVLGDYFQYDSSLPDVEVLPLFTSNKGCGSVFFCLCLPRTRDAGLFSLFSDRTYAFFPSHFHKMERSSFEDAHQKKSWTFGLVRWNGFVGLEG